MTFHGTKVAAAMIQSIWKFEGLPSSIYSIVIQNIRVDNGVYTSADFKVDCVQKNQGLSFCTVGGDWMNRIVEYFIGTITQCAILFFFMQCTNGQKW